MVLSPAKKKPKHAQQDWSPHQKSWPTKRSEGEFRDPSNKGNVMDLSLTLASFYSALEIGEKGSAPFARSRHLINLCSVWLFERRPDPCNSVTWCLGLFPSMGFPYLSGLKILHHDFSQLLALSCITFKPLSKTSDSSHLLHLESSVFPTWRPLSFLDAVLYLTCRPRNINLTQMGSLSFTLNRKLFYLPKETGSPME